jgi:hypothetical protein
MPSAITTCFLVLQGDGGLKSGNRAFWPSLQHSRGFARGRFDAREEPIRVRAAKTRAETALGKNPVLADLSVRPATR